MIQQLWRRLRRVWEPLPPVPPPPPPLGPNDEMPKDELRARLLQALNQEAKPHLMAELEMIRKGGPRR